ncbi:MAG: hypothetical protein SGPRY_003596 [Prymnesium sp.]
MKMEEEDDTMLESVVLSEQVACADLTALEQALVLLSAEQLRCSRRESRVCARRARLLVSPQ